MGGRYSVTALRVMDPLVPITYLQLLSVTISEMEEEEEERSLINRS